MRNRVDQLGVAEPEIQTSGDNQITVGLPNVSDTGRAEAEVGTTAQLLFYDWEANVITANGKTVADSCRPRIRPRPRSVRGGDDGAPGEPGSGSMNLYDAVELASKQPESSSHEIADRPPVLHVRGAGECGVPGGGEGQRHRARGGSALPALGARRQQDGPVVGGCRPA